MEFQGKEVIVRIACRSSTGVVFPDEFNFQVPLIPDDIRQMTMKKVECVDCKGSGTVKLFVSDSLCDKCLGHGYYAEGGWS